MNLPLIPDHDLASVAEFPPDDGSDYGENSALYFKNAKFESQEMRKFLSLQEPDPKIPSGLDNISYKVANVFPEWVLTNQNWIKANQFDPANAISEILKIPANKRTQEQTSTLVHWLMTVWKVAQTMGVKRCASMIKEFKYQVFEPGENIITEGERGLKFYIIISGNTEVHKEDIGVVGQLGKGKSFGEIALTQGKDVRTATITALSQVEVLSLHKLDYEYFVRDIQESERRENIHLLQECKLFKNWSRAKIDKMSNLCRRRTYDQNEYIFHQGDKPDFLYVVLEGSVNIIKEVFIISRNRWPASNHSYEERIRRVNKPLILNTLQKHDFFGEVAILKNLPRTTSAVACAKTVLLTLDRMEFLHMISYGTSALTADGKELKNSEATASYIADKDILETVARVSGGPSSVAIIGNKLIKKPSRSTNKFKIDMQKKKEFEQERKREKEGNSRPSSPSAGLLHNEEDKMESLNDRMLKIAKGNDIAEQLRNVTNAAKAEEIKRKAKFEWTRTGTSTNLISDGATPIHRRPRSRLETPKRFGAGGNSTVVQRRNSLNIDNDPSYNYDGRVILRRNSSFQVDELIEQVSRQNKGITALGTPKNAQTPSKQQKLQPVRRKSLQENSFFEADHPANLHDLALIANISRKPNATPYISASTTALAGVLSGSHDEEQGDRYSSVRYGAPNLPDRYLQQTAATQVQPQLNALKIDTKVENVVSRRGSLLNPLLSTTPSRKLSVSPQKTIGRNSNSNDLEKLKIKIGISADESITYYSPSRRSSMNSVAAQRLRRPSHSAITPKKSGDASSERPSTTGSAPSITPKGLSGIRE